MNDSLTTPDRAARARMAWELYSHAYSDSQVQDLIADLMHLADTDEHPVDGATAARRGVAQYVAEMPIWPCAAAVTEPACLAQFRLAGEDWVTAAEGDELRDVANCLWYVMQHSGLRTSEIPQHVDDLVQGHVLTAEDGTAFRAFKNPRRA